MDAEKIHVEESSCALCENKTGSAWKCCCPDDNSKLRIVSEERLRKRINLKEHQKLCQFHYKKLESGLLFGGTNIYTCCAPFHVDSPKKQNLKAVPYNWRSYFQSPSSDKRYRTTQRICRECYMLAIEAINSESDAFDEGYNDLGYHSASFDLGYVSPKQWATNIARSQTISPRSLSGSSWSLTPSTHSNSSVKAHRLAIYLKKDPNSGIGKLRKRLQMTENGKISPTHSEPDLRLPSPTSSVDDKPILKADVLPVTDQSGTLTSIDSLDYAKPRSFESTDDRTETSFSDQQGDALSDSDKRERATEEIVSDEDLNSDDSSLTESQHSTPSDSVEYLSINNAEHPDSPKPPVKDENLFVEKRSDCSALQELPVHRVSRGPTFYPIFTVPDVSELTYNDQCLQKNSQEVDEMLPEIKPIVGHGLKQEVGVLDTEGSYIESTTISELNNEVTKSDPSSDDRKLVNLSDSSGESCDIGQLSSPFTYENDPAQENEFEKVDEDRDTNFVTAKTIEQESTEYQLLKANGSVDPELTNGIETSIDRVQEQTTQALPNGAAEDEVKPKEETFVGLRRRPRNTMPVPDPELLRNFRSDQTHDGDASDKLSEPDLEITNNKQENQQEGESKNEEENTEKSEAFAKTALYTELHGSKADEVEVSKSTEECDEVPDISRGGDRFRDNERARQFRRRMQNRSQSLFQHDNDDSDDQVEKTENPIFTSFQTEQPSLRRSIWREKRRKFGMTFKQPTKAEDEHGKNDSEHSESEEKTLDTAENEDVSAVLSDIFESTIAYVTGSHPREEASSKSFYFTVGVTLLLSVTLSGFALLFFQ